MPEVKNLTVNCLYQHPDNPRKTMKAPVKKRPQKEIDREKEVKQREAELAELTEGAYKLRRDFVMNLTISKVDYPKLMNHACRVMIVCKTQYIGYDFAKKYCEYLNITLPESRPAHDTCDYILGELDKTAFSVRPLIAAIYAAYGDSKTMGYWQKSYSGEFPCHYTNQILNYIYGFLCEFGYEMSDTEKALKDGTHPLLMVEEKPDPKEADAAQETSGAS